MGQFQLNGTMLYKVNGIQISLKKELRSFPGGGGRFWGNKILKIY